MIGRKSRRVATLVAVSFLLTATAGCAHRVQVTSDPDGAKVAIDGFQIGVTPATFLETSGFSKTYQIKIEREGYRSYTGVLAQEINPLYAALSIGFGLFTLCGFLGLLWSFTLQDHYHFNLQRA